MLWDVETKLGLGGNITTTIKGMGRRRQVDGGVGNDLHYKRQGEGCTFCSVSGKLTDFE